MCLKHSHITETQKSRIELRTAINKIRSNLCTVNRDGRRFFAYIFNHTIISNKSIVTKISRL